jgi:sirohydrochlorin ferrochelatase
MSMKAVIFIGHGSKSSGENEKFISHFVGMRDKNGKFTSHFGMLLAEKGISIIGCGFLENAEPSIFQAVESAIQAGASEVTIVPVLLLPGVHANHDIPEAVRGLRIKHPGIVFRLCEAIGAHPLMVEIMLERLKEKGHKGEEVILIAHGSRVPNSTVQFERLAAMLGEQLGAKVQVAYFTTSPSYRKVITDSPAGAYVLPYILFSRGFLKKLQDLEEERRICDPVGFDSKLQAVLLERMTNGKVVESW